MAAAPGGSAGAQTPIAGSFTSFRARYARVLEWIVGALMVILAVEVTLGVVFRSIGRSLIWYDEVASVLLAWLTFYGSALASVKRAHIGCPEIVDQLSWPLRRALNVIAQLLVIVFFALLGAVGAWILPVLHGMTLVSLPTVPMSVVQSVIPLSAALILIAEVMHLIELLTARRPPDVVAGDDPALADGLH